MNSAKGVLLLVNNYTGDRMAFDMAQEMAEAEDIKVRTLFIDDDVAVQDSTYTVGRRGVAGNFFVMKAVGAAVREGRRPRRARPDRREGQQRHPHHGHGADRLHPAGQGLAAVRPARRRDRDGRRHPRRAGPPPREARSANEIVDELLEAVVSDLPFESGDRVALMVNGLGGTPISELYLLTAARTSSWPTAASRSAAAMSASTARRSTWPAPRSPWSGSTTRSSRCWRSPPRSPSASSDLRR